MRERFGGGRAGYDRAYHATARDPVLHRMRGSKRWQRLREWFLSAHPLCQSGRHGRFPPPATDVHHVKPAATHPDLFFDDGNLMGLCRPCHALENARERHGA